MYNYVQLVAGADIYAGGTKREKGELDVKGCQITTFLSKSETLAPRK